ncbi:hypothetical protein D3C78_1768130 [compost metagenome]
MTSASSEPLLTWGRPVMMVSKYIDTWPESSAGMASPAPLYGTCRISMPAMDFSISPAMCEVVPVPNEAYVSLPGLARA